MSILFAILACLAGLFLSFIIGIAGVIITVIFGALSIFFAMKKRKTEGGGGIGSIVFSSIAIILSLLLFLGWLGICDKFKDEAEKKDAPLVKEAFENSTFGLIGVMTSIDADKQEELMDELKRITDSDESSSSSAESSSDAAESSSK